MTPLAIAMFVLLWLAIIILAVSVAALARQVGILHERIAPAGALTLHQKVNIGDAITPREYHSLDGRTIAIGKGGRHQLLFFVSPDCPVCKSLLPVFKSAASAEKDWLDVILASDGDEAAQRRMIKAQGLQKYPYILSEALGRSLGVSKLPYAVLLDEAGRIASLGLVNNREHLESLFEASERGVTSIQDYLSARAHNTEKEAQNG